MSSNPIPIRLVEYKPAHREFIRALSAEVFSRFGDYDRTLPSTSSLPWIETVVAERDGQPIGFAMYTVVGRKRPEIDLMAIAVEPRHQTRGTGRLLLAHVESVARGLAADGRCSIRLTVAEENVRARKLFERSGFVHVPGGGGSYPRGQRSLSLVKQL